VPTRSAHHTIHGLHATNVPGLKLVESTKLLSVQLKYQKKFPSVTKKMFNENVPKPGTPE